MPLYDIRDYKTRKRITEVEIKEHLEPVYFGDTKKYRTVCKKNTISQLIYLGIISPGEQLKIHSLNPTSLLLIDPVTGNYKYTVAKTKKPKTAKPADMLVRQNVTGGVWLRPAVGGIGTITFATDEDDEENDDDLDEEDEDVIEDDWDEDDEL